MLTGVKLVTLKGSTKGEEQSNVVDDRTCIKEWKTLCCNSAFWSNDRYVYYRVHHSSWYDTINLRETDHIRQIQSDFSVKRTCVRRSTEIEA